MGVEYIGGGGSLTFRNLTLNIEDKDNVVRI